MRVSRKNVKWYVADFETTGINYYNEHGYVKVWLYSVSDSDGKIANYGDSIEKFIDWCSHNHGALIYFHNLRFDGVFLISYLLNNGFTHKEEIYSHDKQGFSTLIGDMGEYYQIKINFAPNKQVTIYDSLKLIPLTVRQIAKAFKLPMEKGTIDYEDYTINDETLDYVFRDTQIVANAIKFFRDKGYTRMTIGSNSYHSFMDNLAGAHILFPRLGKEFINKWREAYRGGRSQVNPKYTNQIMRNVKRYDLNSMYPSIMAQCYLPYGKPIECKTRGKYRFELYHLQAHFKLKDGHLPTLLRTNTMFNKAGDTYWINTEAPIDLYVSNLDWELVEKHYDIIYVKYLEIIGFKTVKGPFKQWVEEMYKNKSESEGGLRLVYKLLLNSLYGKFGSKCEGINKIPVLNDDGEVTYVNSDKHDMSQYYLPMAIAITSWAHVIIDNAIMKVGYDNFVYCDTDSVHTTGELPPEDVDNKQLGKFKLEGIEEVSKYIRQKTYCYYENGNWNITCAGMSQSIKDYLVREYGDKVIDIMSVGLTVDEHSPNVKKSDLKLMPKKVRGGVLLVPTPFSLK